MRKREIPAFTSALSKREAILVLLYIPMHVALLQLLLSHLAQIGTLSLPTANLLYYAIGFVYMVAAGFGFLRRDFDPLADRPFYTLLEILSSYGWMFIANFIVGMLMAIFIHPSLVIFGIFLPFAEIRSFKMIS